MLLNKRNLEIVKIAGSDDARYPMNSLFIDVEAKRTVATDGHRLVTVSLPEGVKDEDFPQVNGLTASPLAKNCLLPTEAVEKVLKAVPKKPALHISSYVAIDGVKTDADETLAHLCVTDLEAPQVFTVRKKEGSFPDYRQLFPKTPATARISVNASYLVEILQIAKCYDDRNSMVEIQFRGSDQPLVIRAHGKDTNQLFKALLMPLRTPKRSPETPPCEEANLPESGSRKIEPDSKHQQEQPEDDLQEENGGSMPTVENQSGQGVSARDTQTPE